MQNTLELKRLVYGFRKDGIELDGVKSVEDLETVTGDRIQAIVWEFSKGYKQVVSIEELTTRDMTFEKAVKKLKDRAKKLHAVVNVKVPVIFCYGGNVER